MFKLLYLLLFILSFLLTIIIIRINKHKTIFKILNVYISNWKYLFHNSELVFKYYFSKKNRILRLRKKILNRSPSLKKTIPLIEINDIKELRDHLHKFNMNTPIIVRCTEINDIVSSVYSSEDNFLKSINENNILNIGTASYGNNVKENITIKQLLSETQYNTRMIFNSSKIEPTKIQQLYDTIYDIVKDRLGLFPINLNLLWKQKGGNNHTPLHNGLDATYSINLMLEGQKDWVVFDVNHKHYLGDIYINSDHGFTIPPINGKPAIIENFPKHHSINHIPEIYEGTLIKGDLLFFNDEHWHQVKNVSQNTVMYNLRFFKQHINAPWLPICFTKKILLNIWNKRMY